MQSFKILTVLKKLSLDSMFNLMKEHHKKFNSLNKLKPQKEINEKRKQEVWYL